MSKKKKKYTDKYENFNITEVLATLLKKRREKKEVKSIWKE